MRWGQQIRYFYDSYGRLTNVQHWAMSATQYGQPPAFQDQPDQDVSYYYDQAPDDTNGFTGNTWGRLAEVLFHIPGDWLSQMQYFYNYNTAGRVLGQEFVVDGPTLVTTYMWDNQGRMTGIAYPVPATTMSSSPDYQYTYDGVGRLSAITGQSCWYDGYYDEWFCTPQTVASATYNAAGQIATLQYDSFNETRQYNSIQQLISATVTGSSGTVMNMQYGYSSTQNNGRIVQSIDGVLNETVNYTYDTLNRLSTAISTSGSMTQQFSYDGFGNLTGTQGAAVWSFDPSRNAPAGTVDANGNMDAAGYQWNIENRLIAEPTVYGTEGFTYDPWGKRVMEYGGNLANTLVTMYSITGQRLQIYQELNDGSGNLYFEPASGENVYFGGKMIRSQGATVATDRLGSVRGNSNGERMAYLPYGQERGSPTTPDNREKFGTYWRDSTLGVDYADQRYYAYQAVGSWPAGRFWSPDPGGVATADPTNPASWNRYALATGDPINFNDPQGLEDMSVDCGDDDCADPACIDDGDGSCDDDDPGGGGGGGDEQGTMQWVCDDNGDCQWLPTFGVNADCDDPSSAGCTSAQALVPTPPVTVTPTPTPWYTTLGRFVTNVPGMFVTGFFTFFQGHTSGCETLTCWGIMPQPPEVRGAEHRKKRKSTYEKHTGRRPGTSPPPNYVPYRKHVGAPEKPDKPPYHRKDRDPSPGSGGQ